MDASDWIAIAAFAVQCIGTIVIVTWKLSRVELALSAQITEERKEVDDHIDQQNREFGETAHALRQKIHEVEMWSRDNFVRREGFYIVKEEISEAIRSVATTIGSRLDRLEATIRNGD